MARVNCGKCGVSENPKTTATIYWRTRPPGQEFEKWKQRLCRDCFAAEVTPRIRIHSEAPNACAAKGSEHDDQVFDVWATIYTPRHKDGPTWDDSFVVCESHMPWYL